MSYGCLPQVKPRVFQRGFSRLLDGPSWGLSRTAERLAEGARFRDVNYFVPEERSTALKRRLHQLGVISLAFPKGTTSREIKRTIREILYRKSLKQKLAADFGAEVKDEDFPLNFTKIRKRLEEAGAAERFTLYLKRIFLKYSRLDVETLSNLLAIFPRTYNPDQRLLEKRGSIEIPEHGSGWHLHREIESHIVGHHEYTEMQIVLVKEYLGRMRKGERDRVLAALTAKNHILFLTLQGLNVEGSKKVRPERF
jgi:hypothetical protein